MIVGAIRYMLTYDHGVPVGNAYSYGSNGEIEATIIFDKDNPENSIILRKNDEGEMILFELRTDLVFDAYFF